MEASLNRRCREALSVFERAVALADEQGCDAGFVLGDLLDYQRPEAQLVTEVQRVLRSARARWTLLVGNHDLTSTTPGDHALGPFRNDARVVEEPESVTVGGVEVACVPFRPGSPAEEWLPAVLGARWPIGAKRGPRVLALHLGVSDDGTPPWLRGAPDSIEVGLLTQLAAAYGFEHVFAGNWHDRRVWDIWVADAQGTCGVCGYGPGGGQHARADGGTHEYTAGRSVKVLQLGALVPTGWDNPGVEGYGTLAVWDGGQVAVRWVAGPRFIKATGKRPDEVRSAVEDARAMGHHPYLDATVAGEHMAETSAALEALGVPGEVHAEAGDALVEARTAATAARCADTLEAALGGFVREMPLSVVLDGPDAPELEAALRADVLSEAKRYMAAGA